MVQGSGIRIGSLRLHFCFGVFLAGISLLATPILAALNYHTYVVENIDNYIYRNGDYIDSVSIAYVLTQMGSVSLEASSIQITSQGSYLDIVEEGTLSGNLDYRPDNSTHDFLFQGSLPIPSNAAVRGLEVYHDDTLFTSILKKMVYSIDKVFVDSAALAATLNGRVTFLQQLSDQAFEATFAKVALGDPITVRLHYEIPMPGSPNAPVNVPVIFQPSGSAPKTVDITFIDNDSAAGAFQWVGPTGLVAFKSRDVHTVAYNPTYTFRRQQPKHSLASMQTTGFPSGDWNGHYLLLKGGLDDSVMTMLSHPMEVVFLWRWNNPAEFVTTDYTGLKTLSNEGLQAVAQAQYMVQLARELGARGHRFGLLHNIDGRDSVFMPAALPGDSGFTRMVDYLNGWNAQNLYKAYQNASSNNPDWAPITWTDSNSIAKSQNKFLGDLKTIHDGFLSKNDLRHIVFLGAGVAATASPFDLSDSSAVHAILDSVTISYGNEQLPGVFYYPVAAVIQWPGVDFTRSLAVSNPAIFQTYNSVAPPPNGMGYLLFPVFQPSSVEYRSFTQDRTHSVIIPFDTAAQTQVLMKAGSSFVDSLELQGIDILGRNTRLLQVIPRFASSTGDSGLARLWAADANRIFENTESNLGMRYGILSKGSYFSAGMGSGILTGPDGNPIDIQKVFSRASASPFRIVSGNLTLQIPAAPGMVLQAYDSRGRRVVSIPLDAYRSGTGYRIPLSLFRNLGLKRIILMLRSEGKIFSFTLWLGGAR